MSEEISGVETTEPEKEEKRTKRLTPAQWSEIREHLELGSAKTSELATRYGITPQAISAFCQREKITRGSRSTEIGKKVAGAITGAAVKEAVSFADKRRSRIEETKEQGYTWAKIIGQQTMKVVAEAAQKSLPLGNFGADLKALRIAAAIAESTLKQRYQVLDAENDIDEKTLPTLAIETLTQEEINQLQNADMDDDGLEAPDLSAIEEENEVIEEDEDGAAP